MSFLRTNISQLHKKQFSKYLGMSLSSPSLPEQIRNIFWMYYIPEDNETYAINNRKEAAFFGLTLMCNLDKYNMDSNVFFESKLWLLMNNGTESDKRKINALFMSNMTTTREYVETIGRVLRKESNLDHINGVNINRLIIDLIGLGDIYQSARIKQKWASKIYKIEEDVS